MPVRTKAWEDALAFQSGWKRLGTSPRSARAGTEEASTADSVSRKSILLYYTPKQNRASVVNKITAPLLKKNGSPRLSRELRGGSLNSHLHAILAFREWPGGLAISSLSVGPCVYGGTGTCQPPFRSPSQGAISTGTGRKPMLRGFGFSRSNLDAFYTELLRSDGTS